MKTTLAILVVAILSGCASSGVVRNGSDQYVIQKTSLRLGIGPPTAVAMDVRREADEFCSLSKKMFVVQREQWVDSYPASPGSVTLYFYCK